MKLQLLHLSVLLFFFVPITGKAQATRDAYRSITEVYTDPTVHDGDVIQVVGYYTNTDYNLLLHHYADFLKDQPLPPHSCLILTGLIPPAGAWNGGYIAVTGTVSFIPYPDHFNPEDTVLAYLDASQINVILPGGSLPSAPAGGQQEQHKTEPGINMSVTSACDPCKFAFLLSGGIDEENNRAKYWENLVALYRFKVDSLGYCDSNVFVHYYKGTARDGRIPAGRVIRADSTKIDSTFDVIARRVAACNRAGTPATFQKMVTNHGAPNGDICLLGDDVLTPGHLKDEQQKVIDSCCRTVYDEFIECYGGYVVDAVSNLNLLNKATVYANSAADKRTGWSSDGEVHSYLQAKINALDSGKSYPDAVVAAKLAYDQYLNGVLTYLHNLLNSLRADPTIPDRDDQIADATADSISVANSICESRNVTLIPFTTYCQWQKIVVPPGGQMVIDFSAFDPTCGNVTVYREDPETGILVKVAVWNWNIPGSFGFLPGNDTRVINSLPTDTTTFWIHNDNGAIKLKVEAKGSATLAESPSNIFAYPGFSFGGTNSSSSEFGLLTSPTYFINNIDQLFIPLSTLPARLGPGFVGDFGFSFQISPTNAYWSDMELFLNIKSVVEPAPLIIMAQGGTIPTTQVLITTPGVYTVPLGNFTLNGPYGSIHMLPLGNMQIEFDSWGFRSRYVSPLQLTTTWTGGHSSNWTDPENWSNGVPGTNYYVTITSGVFQPVIITDISIKGITILPDASVTTAPGASLILTGN